MYLKLQIKRAMKIYPSILLVSAVMLVGAALAIWGLSSLHAADESRQKIAVGVVGDTNDTFLGIGIAVLQDADQIRHYVQFEQMDETQAKSALAEGSISGYVIVPERFINGLITGRNIPVRYITRQGTQDLGDVLSKEALDVVSHMVLETQNGIYSMQMAAYANNAYANISSKVERMNLSYIDFVLNRSEIYELKEVGVRDYLTYPGYYLCSFILLFLLLWGISCAQLLGTKNVSLSCLVCQRGIGALKQTIFEHVAFLVITLISVLILAIVIGCVVSAEHFGIRELLNADIIRVLVFAVRLLPVLCMVTAMHLMLYEIFTNMPAAILAQVLIIVVLGYVSGCFYPESFFPEAVNRIADALPIGAGFSFVKGLLADEPTLWDTILVWSYTVAFLGITAVCRRRKIAGDM